MGCATTPYVAGPLPQGMPGIYHRVEKGQTLWRISKIYNVDLDEIVSINRISDATNIEIGQLIFIPRRQKEQVLSEKSFGEDFIWPLRGKTIAGFGQNFNDMINKGINIQAYSDCGIVASRSGKVVFYSPDFQGYGKTIIIDHGDEFSTVYARNSEVFIKVGDIVHGGDLIAKVRSSGSNGNEYLHFEIRKGYTAQNPYFYLP
jgi:murein DD-endopeptidase MepM/ murein hydrolase activator NlpD